MPKYTTGSEDKLISGMEDAINSLNSMVESLIEIITSLDDRLDKAKKRLEENDIDAEDI